MPVVDTGGYYARFILGINKWPNTQNTRVGNCKWWMTSLSPDILNDLKTSSKELSWWHLNDCSDEELNLLAASTISAFKNKAAKTLSFVLVPDAVFNRKFKMVSSPKNGDTALVGYEERHYDMSDLTIRKILSLVDIVAPITCQENYKCRCLKRISASVAMGTLRAEYNAGRVRTEKLASWITEKMELSAR